MWKETPPRPPRMSSVEPPPMSTTSVSASSSRPAETPRKVRSASSSPVRSRVAEAVAPLDLAEERLAVLGVAHGARRESERALGAALLDRAAVVVEDVPDARDRLREEVPPRVHAFAEPRDLEPAVDLAHVAVVDVGDEQPGRVRAEVDGRDAGHFAQERRRFAAARPSSRTSPSAQVSTEKRSSDVAQASKSRLDELDPQLARAARRSSSSLLRGELLERAGAARRRPAAGVRAASATNATSRADDARRRRRFRARPTSTRA